MKIAKGGNINHQLSTCESKNWQKFITFPRFCDHLFCRRRLHANTHVCRHCVSACFSRVESRDTIETCLSLKYDPPSKSRRTGAPWDIGLVFEDTTGWTSCSSPEIRRERECVCVCVCVWGSGDPSCLTSESEWPRGQRGEGGV